MQDIPIKRRSLKLILSIKPRVFLFVGLSLAALFLTIVVVGVRENRDNIKRMMKDQARGLVEAVMRSSGNTVAASNMVDNLLIDKLSDVAALTGLRFEEGDLSPLQVARICQATGINRMDVVNPEGEIVMSSVVDAIGAIYEESFIERFPFEDIAMGHVRSASFVIGDDNPVIPAQLVLATARGDSPGAVVLFNDYSVLESFNERIGIGTLIREIGSETGIEYIFFQTDEGVVLSSRDLGQVLKIEADPFVRDILEESSFGAREVDFQGENVLEVIRPFEASGFPRGVLRIGLSMDGFEQVSRNFTHQLTAIGAILFVVSFLVVTLFLANLNYRTLESSFVEMKRVTGNILDSMQSAVVVVDSSGTITSFNPRAEEMFKRREADAVGRKYSELFDDDPLMLEKVGRETSRSERRIRLPDGREIEAIVAASEVAGPDGREIGAVSLVHDVTEERRMERAAKRSERLSELGNLAAGVAHEIRNPLNAIGIASQRLKSEFEPKEDSEEYVQLVGNIRSEIDRLNDIINQFLALARSHASKRDDVDLVYLVSEVRRLMDAEARERQIEIVSDLSDSVVIEASRDDLKKVLINLIKNSIEACSAGDKIWLSLTREDTEAKLAIEDSGPGIAEDKRERVFRPYFTTKESGTGLGLALSHRIVSDHDGSLEYEERNGGGARFVITLPIRKER